MTMQICHQMLELLLVPTYHLSQPFQQKMRNKVSNIYRGDLPVERSGWGRGTRRKLSKGVRQKIRNVILLPLRAMTVVISFLNLS